MTSFLNKCLSGLVKISSLSDKWLKTLSTESQNLIEELREEINTLKYHSNEQLESYKQLVNFRDKLLTERNNRKNSTMWV